MENSYGIGVHNRYELFYDDEVDPLDIIKENEKKVKDKVAEKENKSSGTKVINKKGNNSILKKPVKGELNNKVTDKTNGNESRAQNQRGRNNDSRVKFSDREERNNRRNRPDDFNNSPRFDVEGGGRGNRVEGENRNRFDGEGGGRGRFDGEGRGRGRGRGMGRGRGRGRGGMGGPDGRGKREFDRQSGMATTGVKSVDKREGSGSFNWGSDKDQIEDSQAEETPELDTSNENVEKPTEDTAGQPTEVDEIPKEEEHHEMTLDEWKSLQKQRSKPQYNIRKAGEGENTNQWKKTYILKKKEDDEDDSEEEDDDEDEVHHGRRKVLLNIDFKFSDSPVRGRGRGRGRGGDRGGKGRGVGRGGSGGERGGGSSGMGERASGPRGERGRGGRSGGRQEAPKMDDEQDFPSLG